MKKLLSVIASLSLTASVFAQAPEKMSYQAVIRDASNALVTTNVAMKISILQSSGSGTAVYIETQTPTPNANGLVSIEIGGGTIVSGTIANIKWENGPYFIKTETDIDNNTTYDVTATSQLLSTPYALYAKSAGNFKHYLGEDFNGGIIFEIYRGSDSLEHGLIVAKTESLAQWQSNLTLLNANRTEDGLFNTSLMTASPAATYVATLGAGWYIPSLDELNKLYYNRYYVQKALRAGGHTLLYNGGYYWSSTEYSITYAYNLFFGSGVSYDNLKSSVYYVRGIKAF